MLKTGRQILFPLLKLSALELVRSVSFARNLLAGFFVVLIIGYLAIQILGAAIFLGPILRNFFDIQDIPSFLSSAAIYYLLAEFIARFFMQKPPLLDLRKYLHLPIRRSAIVQFLFARSLVSLFTFVVLLLFLPITLSDIAAAHGSIHGAYWLGTLFFLSITLHFLVLWIKRSPRGGFLKGLLIVGLPSIPFFLLFFKTFNLGVFAAPFFELSFSGPVPLVVSASICLLSGIRAYRVYRRNAYVELPDTAASGNSILSGNRFRLLSAYGLPGVIADTELKLVLRHKKSRGYLIMCILFLLYGILFYGSSGDGIAGASAYLHLFIGAFITGSFLLQYGQLLLSWNSASFDFYMTRRNGLYAMIKGKFLLLTTSVAAAYVLAIPYVYYGWEVLAFHTAALLYNAGIGVHVIIILSLWQPKPMDINKGATFNYDGIGIAQFIMVIPYILLMYLIFFVFDVMFGTYGSLIVLGFIGLLGLIFYERLLNISVKRLHRQRHNISTSFRQEL